MILIVKLLNFIKRLWQCIKWIPDLYKYTGNCLKFAFLSVLKEHNVLPASYFQNLHFIIFGYPVYTMEYFNISFFEFSFFDCKSDEVWHFSLFSFFSSLNLQVYLLPFLLGSNETNYLNHFLFQYFQGTNILHIFY